MKITIALLCGCKFKKKTITRAVVFLVSFFVFVTCNMLLVAQVKLSADVTTRQLYNDKVIRIEKQMFFSSNGNLVVHYTYPQEYYMITNSFGEASIYQPDVNEVVQINDKSLSSQNEFIMLFLTPAYRDLNLTNIGFVLNDMQKDGGRIVKTFYPEKKSDTIFAKAVVVSEKNNPIYSAFYNKDDKILKKTYYSDYVTYPNISFPSVITQISYDLVKGDSVIKKEEYKNIKTKDFNNNALFEYKVPKNAKRVEPYKKK